MKVLVVGGGPTGTLIAQMLSKLISPTSLAISVWEKSRGCGGRMATARFGAALGNDNYSSVDIGAQYISSTLSYQDQHFQLYKDLLDLKVLVPLDAAEIIGQNSGDPQTKHYISPNGLSSVARHFLSQSGAEFCVQTRLSGLELRDDGVIARSEGGKEESFDCVFLTMPVPQILGLDGLSQLLEEDEKAVLEGVTYSSRFALAIKLPDDFDVPVAWTAMYITDSACVRFICLDSRKRGLGKPHVLLVHTGVPYCLKHFEDKEFDWVEDILKHVRQILPWLPAQRDQLTVKHHRWRYSQVHRVVEGSPGHLTLSRCPRVVLCGDAFTHSNLDGCISSAIKTIRSLNQNPVFTRHLSAV